jgi:hypothetical protein
MSCVLRIKGEDFAVDAFVASSALVPRLVWRKGYITRVGREPNLDSGCNIVVSETMDFAVQVNDAIAFLRNSEADLVNVCCDAAVDSVCLDFGIKRKDVPAQFTNFPRELVELAGKYGMSLELSLYAQA